MFKRVYEKIKKMFFSKKQINPRGSDDLFKTGEIFDATDIELENIIKEMATRVVPNIMSRDREMIRALVVNNIQNQRFIKSIENRNLVLTIIIIGLTIFNIYLTKIQVAPVLFEQERSERRAYDICKNNPQGEYTGLNGAIIKCVSVFDYLKDKFE